MEKVKLTIHVIPNQVPVAELDEVTSQELGTNLSTASTINVSKVPDGYSIVYMASVFEKLDPLNTINYIIKLFMSKLPGKQILVSMEYHFTLKDGMELFNGYVGNIISDMDDILIEIGNNTSAIVYERSESVDNTIDYLISSDPDDEDGDDEDDEDDFDPNDFDPNDVGGLINLIANEGSRSKKKKSKKKSRDYGESEVLHETKNAKRCYNRHGVMVCSDKDALKHDQKMIKEFLKDFIPGDAEWKKDFRRDLQKRWMQMYVISKKQLKHLQKKHVKSKSKKRRGIDTEKALDFTRRVFNVPANSAWNDPNR